MWIHADGVARPEIQDTEPFKGLQGPLEIGLAIELLSRTGNAEAEPLLVKFLNIINPDAGKRACAVLATLGDARALGPLLEVVQRPGGDLQPEAAPALSAFQDPRIVLVLLQALRSDNRSLRGAAAAALGHFHDARAVSALVHALSDEDADVQVAVAKALGELDDPAAVEPLGRVVETNYEAVRALGKIKSPASVTVLVNTMQDKQSPNRLQAASALATMDDPRVVPALIQTMEQEVASNPSSTLAVRCVQALGTIRDSRAVEPLRKLLGKQTNGKSGSRARAERDGRFAGRAELNWCGWPLLGFLRADFSLTLCCDFFRGRDGWPLSFS